MIRHNYPGLFITFEGLDGAGSSSQVERLKKSLNELGYRALDTKEPTNNIVGGLIRGILTKQWSLPPEGFQLLFAADRSHHLIHSVIPQLEKGHIIISDRYAFSSIAFGALELNQVWLKCINDKFILPDLTILLKVAPETCIERIGKSRAHFELFEEVKKLKKVWRNYEKLAADKANKIIIVNGERTKDEVEAQVLAITRSLLSRKFPSNEIK
ncbi:MAG: dTMP kinase [Patescibacteria group bacterium]